MTRARQSRSNNSVEIPLARRSSPVRRVAPEKVKLFVGLSLALGVSLSLVFFIRFNSVFFKGELPLPSQDGRVLGHYPYSEASPLDLIAVYPGLEIHKDTYSALMAMSAAASRDGVDLVLLSGYRSIELQKEIFFENKSIRNQIAVERAKVSAPPGYSEHSTGYAIDLGDASRRETDFEESFESTPAFRWLNKNAAKYHFVLSFPRGNPQKVSYEPWHWRFEGTVESLRKFQPANELLRSN